MAALCTRHSEAISRARDNGLSITCDAYPYVSQELALRDLLPREITIEALDDDALASAVAVNLNARFGNEWPKFILARTGDEALLDLCGMPFDDIARAWRLRRHGPQSNCCDAPEGM